TDRKDLTSDEIWRIYTLLTRAEDAFRDMKSPLVVRPIFHQKEHRSDAHIFVSLLAYHLLTAIEKTLLDQGIHTSWVSARDTLKTHQVCTVVLPVTTAPVCASARPPRLNPTSNKSIATPRPPRRSAPRSAHESSPKIVTKERHTPLMQNTSAQKKMEVGLAPPTPASRPPRHALRPMRVLPSLRG